MLAAWLRLALEIALGCGVLLAWGVHVTMLLAAGVPGLVSGIGSLVLGNAISIPLVCWACRRSASARLRLDAWLTAWWPAAFATWALVAARWPIRGQRSDAHGWGMHGGEANTLLFPFLHCVVVTALLVACARLSRPNDCERA
jgi:hypothetical protein